MENNGYQLSRAWFDFCFSNPELINPTHTAIFTFAIEHCNRLGWKEKFGFPSQMTMDALGIKNHHTYIKYFNDLVDWGFFKLIQKSANQYSANIISLNCGKSKNSKALDKAFIIHASKQPTKQHHSNPQSNDSIDKPINQLTNEPINKESNLYILGDHSDEKYLLVIPPDINSPKYRINGISGFKQYFEMNKSIAILRNESQISQFMLSKPGAHYDDFRHVYNSFNKFRENNTGQAYGR